MKTILIVGSVVVGAIQSGRVLPTSPMLTGWPYADDFAQTSVF
jgi:hypothetical protein